MTTQNINFLIAATFFLIIISLLFFQISDFDILLQNNFFNLDKKQWFIDSDEPIKKFIFYEFPKILLGFFITTILLFTILGFKNKSQYFFNNRYKFLLIFLGLTLIPLIAGNIKKFTNIYCPKQLEIYNGKYEYVKIFDNYNLPQEKKGQCFPAGHAVTGFCLFILFFTSTKKSTKIFSFLLAFLLGWLMGIYQILKGAHFLSDTIIAMLICFLLAALLYKFFNRYIHTI